MVPGSKSCSPGPLWSSKALQVPVLQSWWLGWNFSEQETLLVLDKSDLAAQDIFGDHHAAFHWGRSHTFAPYLWCSAHPFQRLAVLSWTNPLAVLSQLCSPIPRPINNCWSTWRHQSYTFSFRPSCLQILWRGNIFTKKWQGWAQAYSFHRS